MSQLLDIRNLDISLVLPGGMLHAVKDVSLSLDRGEALGIVGESGSGKSMTALALMRLLPRSARPKAARLAFDGQDLPQLDDRTFAATIAGPRIGMIFQEPLTSLNPVYTIGRQMTEAAVARGLMSASAARKKAVDLLDRVGIPDPQGRMSQFPHQMSGGQRQRVMIAMTLMLDPDLLIADEPTTALDVTVQAQILDLLDDLRRERQMGLILISHDLAVVAERTDKVAVMYAGELVEQGPAKQVMFAPQHDYTRALLAAVPKLGEMIGKDYPEPMKLMGVEDQKIEPIKGTDEVLLEVKNLTTRFPVKGGVLRRTVANVHAVEDVSFKVFKGQTLSLVGESGCGKSSAGRSILRLVEPMSGQVNFEGRDILGLSNSQMHKARLDMQMIFQDPFASLNPQMQLLDQVAEPMRNYGLASGSELQDRVASLFDRVHLPRSFMRRYPHEMSGGQRQRIAIARALALNPKLIVADEAVSALDVSVQAQVLNLMMELQAELGLSFLFISHDMAVVERVSHQVGVMYLGRIVEIGPRDRVFANPLHAYTQALMKAVPIADPRKRKSEKDLNFKPIPSPIHGTDYKPEPSEYLELEPGHFVLTTDSGY